MAETPFARILETIAAVERLQAQVAALAAALTELATRMEAIERAVREGGSPQGTG